MKTGTGAKNSLVLTIVLIIGVIIGVVCVKIVDNYDINGKTINGNFIIDNVERREIRRLATVTTYDGRSDIGDLADKIVAIRNMHQGFLKNPSSSNKVKSHDQYDDNRMLWTVGYDDGRDAYYFENNEDGCYLKSQDGWLKCLATRDDRAHWLDDIAGTHTYDSTSYRRVWGLLKNYDDDKCPDVGSISDEQIAMGTGKCTKAEATFTFEIVADAPP